jgi:hypothetical protein
VSTKKTTSILKPLILVTLSGLLLITSAFVLYVSFFLLQESMGNEGSRYGFVSTYRASYGIIWSIIGLVAYKLKLPDWLKAGFLTASIGTLLVTFSVNHYQSMTQILLFAGFVTAIVLFLLIKTKRKWYHFYALSLALLAVLAYM